MRRSHWLWLLGAVGVALLIGAVTLAVILYKDWQYAESAPYSRAGKPKSKIIVIYYSRSGNTEVMAREIARRYDADILQITSDEYPQNYSGWRKAANDASDQRMPKVYPETVDLSGYEQIFLGSPIWWYYPATPLTAFAGKQDYKSGKVILFNTFNSRFKPEAIDAFARTVTTRGGVFLDHIYVKRGRITMQLDTQELIAQVGQVLREHEAKWGLQAVTTHHNGDYK